MTFYKKISRDINVNGKKRKDLPLNAEIFSYDEQVAKFVLTLTNDIDEINLSSAKTLAVMNYALDGENVSTEALSGVESVDDTSIYFIVPDSMRGFVGDVTAGVYIDLASGEKIDIQNLKFKMSRSLIDDASAPAAEIYFESFEDVLVKVKAAGDKAISDVTSEAQKVIDHADEKISEYDAKFRQSDTKMSELQNKQTELTSKFEESDVFNKAETSANVIAKIDSRNFVDAWKMPDGTFTNVYPGENLHYNYNFDRPAMMANWGGIPATMVATRELTQYEGVNVVKITTTGSGNVSDGFGYSMAFTGVNNLGKNGDKLTFYAEYKFVKGNENSKMKLMEGNLDGGWEVQLENFEDNEWHRIFFSPTLNSSNGATSYYIGLNGNINTDTELLIRYQKIEKGINTDPIFTLPSSVDYVNSFPHYKGQRLADSDNPDDYDWSYSDEYVDYAIAANHVQNVQPQITDLAARVLALETKLNQ